MDEFRSRQRTSQNSALVSTIVSSPFRYMDSVHCFSFKTIDTVSSSDRGIGGGGGGRDGGGGGGSPGPTYLERTVDEAIFERASWRDS
jgi:hypothetical protein